MNPLISVAELAAGINDFALFDCRHDLMNPTWGLTAYQEGHIPGAQYVSLDHELSAHKTGKNGRHPLPTVPEISALFSRLGIDNTTQVVVYDQGSAMFVGRLWWMLRYLGHDRVRVLDGGYKAWQSAGLASSQEAVVRTAKVFTASVKAEMLVTVEQVLAQLDSPTQCIVDARAPARYRGDEEPIDPRAGHIPGALNRPFAANLNPDGTFKNPEVLKAEWQALLGQHAITEVVHQCGSGVSACANLIANEIAGLSGAKLYAGSWSEWSQDATRPIATGV